MAMQQHSQQYEYIAQNLAQLQPPPEEEPVEVKEAVEVKEESPKKEEVVNPEHLGEKTPEQA